MPCSASFNAGNLIIMPLSFLQSETQQEPVELMSTEGGFSLETIYEAAATPTAAINASVPDDSAQDSDESEQAPLITGR